MTQYNIEQTIQEALSYVQPFERDIWVKVGMAIKSELGDQGEYLWDQWSRQDTGRGEHGYVQSNARAVWRSISSHGGISIGFLWATAKEWGWNPSHPETFRVVETRWKEPPERPLEDDHERELRQKDAQVLANKLLIACVIAPHPYLEAKGWPDMSWLTATEETHAHLVPERHSLREWLQMGPLLVVTMRDLRSNEVQTLQFIAPDGTKKFLPGGKASGSVYRIGPHPPRGAVWYCEGFATGLSVGDALRALNRRNDQVVVCFSAGGVESTGKLHRPPRRGYVVADGDEYICTQKDCKHRWTGPWGLKKCPECGGKRILLPTGEKCARETGLPFWVGPPKMDAFDFAAEHGIEKLAEELESLVVG